MDFFDIINVNDFDKICRICLKTTLNLTNIFSTKLKMKMLSDFIMECAPIQIKIDDPLPQSICKDCQNELDRIIKFRTLCVESNEKLLEAFNRFHKNVTIKLELENEPGPSELVEKVEDVDIKVESPDDNSDQFNSGNESFSSAYDPDIERKKVRKSYYKKKVKRKIEYKQDEHGFIHCPHCDDYFQVRRKLQEHIKNCAPRIERIKSSLKNDIEKKIIIPIRRSIRHYGPEKFSIETDSNGRFLCPVCQMDFSDKNIMRRHYRNVHQQKKYKCPECNKAFQCMSELKEHIISHTNEKPYSCEFCGKQYLSRKALLLHQKLHLEPEKFTCPDCNRKFSRYSCFKDHLRLHTGERPYICDYCGKTFNRNHILKSHRMTHTGERPHQCNLCPKKFISKQQLMLHNSAHDRGNIKSTEKLPS